MVKEVLHFIGNWLRIFSISIFFLSLNSCADSEVAKKLANSFDPPLGNSNYKTLDDQLLNRKTVEEDRKTVEEDRKTVEEELLANQQLINSNLLLNEKRSSFRKTSEKKMIPTKKSNSKKELSRFKPQPYRIILRLSGANPSAPAETVTKALREAGVIFEVEKIERFEKGSSSQVGIREGD